MVYTNHYSTQKRKRKEKQGDIIMHNKNSFITTIQGIRNMLNECELMCNTALRLYENKEFVNEHKITIANTTNVCRMFGQLMYFPYSFARIKNRVSDDIYYALNAGNYGTIMGALYSWRFALPLSGIFTPCTNELSVDSFGKPVIYDGSFDVHGRKRVNPVNPANLERLEYFFKENELMMRNFIYPSMVTEKEIVNSAKVLYKKYGVVADKDTASAYACVLGNNNAALLVTMMQ